MFGKKVSKLQRYYKSFSTLFPLNLISILFLVNFTLKNILMKFSSKKIVTVFSRVFEECFKRALLLAFWLLHKDMCLRRDTVAIQSWLQNFLKMVLSSHRFIQLRTASTPLCDERHPRTAWTTRNSRACCTSLCLRFLFKSFLFLLAHFSAILQPRHDAIRPYGTRAFPVAGHCAYRVRQPATLRFLHESPQKINSIPLFKCFKSHRQNERCWNLEQGLGLSPPVSGWVYCTYSGYPKVIQIPKVISAPAECYPLIRFSITMEGGGAWRVSGLSTVFAIWRNTCSNFQNYREPYGRKNVQTHFSMLKNLIVGMNFSENILQD